jgi:outer membrane protein assembly factor BamE (lipoprotein component of BamABCDE complex)
MLKRVIFTTVIFAIAIVACWVFIPRFSTTYASGFNSSGFDALRFFETEDEVRRAIGVPLAVKRINLPETWLYCVDDSTIQFSRHGFTDTATLADACPSVEFSHAGLVTRVDGIPHSIGIGSTHEQVRLVLGMPLHVRSGRTLTTWYFSALRRQNYGYEEVTVTFNETGQLVGKRRTRLAD